MMKEEDLRRLHEELKEEARGSAECRAMLQAFQEERLRKDEV